MAINDDNRMRLGYLSAAPRVSTRPEAELGGPRSHVLGVINAFRLLHWDIVPFIVGDRVPLKWVSTGSEETIRRGWPQRIAADVIRIGMGYINAMRAWREIGHNVDWVYERFAAFQSIGWIFKRHDILWILETNAPLFIESKQDRNTITLTVIARYLEWRAYQNCDILVCISDTLKEIIVQEMDVSEEKIIVIPNGVDTDFFDPNKYEPLRIYEGFTVGFVGNIVDWQGLDLLLTAIDDLNKQGLPIYATFIGGGPARPKLEAQAKQLSLTKHVTFAGYVQRKLVPSYIAGFDMGYSGQVQLKAGSMYLSPLKLYEYMSMAKPVLASNFEDARSAVQPKKTGFIFESGNASAIKQALREAYQNREHLSEMGCLARQKIVLHHSWESRISNLIKIVESKSYVR